MAMVVCSEKAKRITKVMIESKSISEQMELAGKKIRTIGKRQKVPTKIQNAIFMARSMFCTVSIMKTRSEAKRLEFAQKKSQARTLGERGTLCIIIQH